MNYFYRRKKLEKQRQELLEEIEFLKPLYYQTEPYRYWLELNRRLVLKMIEMDQETDESCLRYFQYLRLFISKQMSKMNDYLDGYQGNAEISFFYRVYKINRALFERRRSEYV